MSETITQEKANVLLITWRRLLGLRDWHISLCFDASPWDMRLSDVDGEVDFEETVKTAAIRILREDFCEDRIGPFNFEKTLIHELLHLKFCLLDNSGNALQDRLVHQLIDDLARAFAAVSRGEVDT